MASPKTFPCPVCGEDVPVGAKACPECGACEKSGWNEDASAQDGLDLPDESFDYEKFREEEFGGGRKTTGLPRIWHVTAIILLVIMAALTFYNLMFR